MFDTENATNSIYLAYGSNMNLEQMEYRCPYATVISPVELPGYRLLFRGGMGGAVATIEPAEGGVVPALLWEITPRCEEALDRYEGWPRLYRKEWITVSLGEKEAEAMVYIMNEGHPLGLPGKGYLDSILAGYESAGFDRAALEEAVHASEPAEGTRWATVGTEVMRQIKWW
ncbi:gamma-glutamylcyclotransferase [Ruminococcaceae bacterium OttesenSCG-928-L11]|nr:gamma-glutamylcyclotransferase [Ruminococcaceae bacterium OttesenSCG-928-L11]